LSSWNDLFAEWYVNGIIVFPSNIQERVTPVKLAYWLPPIGGGGPMDDGGWTKAGIHLATNYYNKQDTIRFISVLEDNYNLKCSTHSRNRIYIWAGSCKQFIDIVRPYMHIGNGL